MERNTKNNLVGQVLFWWLVEGGGLSTFPLHVRDYVDAVAVQRCFNINGWPHVRTKSVGRGFRKWRLVPLTIRSDCYSG